MYKLQPVKQALAAEAAALDEWNTKRGHPNIKKLQTLVQNKNIMCVNLGLSPNHATYRCFDKQTGRIYYARHVKFNEQVFHYAESVLSSSSVVPSPAPWLNISTAVSSTSGSSSAPFGMPSAPTPPRINNRTPASIPTSQPRPLTCISSGLPSAPTSPTVTNMPPASIPISPSTSLSSSSQAYTSSTTSPITIPSSHSSPPPPSPKLNLMVDLTKYNFHEPLLPP
jgi:hypothetical protein